MPRADAINAAELLLQRGADDAVALQCGGELLRYRELRAAVARAGRAWRDAGVSVGERVLIGLPDGIDAVLAYLGAMWCGAVAVAVNPRISLAQWQGVAEQTQARAILAADPEALPTALAAQTWTPAYWREAQRASAPMPAMRLAPDAPAAWSHSSGTSGVPKAIVHAQRFALAVERVAAERLGATAADRLFASSRLFFVYPLANSLFAGLKLGATVILDPEWPSATMAMRVIGSARPSIFFAVPSLLRDLLQQGHGPALAKSGLRMAVSAGEALPSTLRDAWEQVSGVPLVDGYGASETMCLVLVDTGGGLRSAPGVTVRWAEDAHAAGTPGRLWVRAPTQSLGYWQRPEEEAEHFRAGGFSPADLFEQHPDGAWRFAGREDSLVKVHGRWVDLAALAETLAARGAGAAAVHEAAAVAVPDADGVQAIALFYVARADAPAEAARLLGERMRDLPAHQRPRWLHAVPELPRTPTGKLLRRQLQQMHGVLLHARTPA